MNFVTARFILLTALRLIEDLVERAFEQYTVVAFR
jgi:hypothetical protein